MPQQTLDLHEPIAIIGLGCVFPEAPNPETYWQNILANRCHIREILEKYTGLPTVYDPNPEAWNKTHTALAACVEPIEFSYKRFRGLPPASIQAADYHFRYTLVAAQDAIDHARLQAQPQYHAKTFVAFANNAYETPMLRDYSNGELYYHLDEFYSSPTFQSLGATQQNEFLEKLKREYFKLYEKLSIDALTASMASSIACRIIKSNGFTGGHVAVDSACASSFAAVDLAIKKLRSQSSDVAIAGGIGGILPFFYIYCSKAKTMSAHGSFPFDTRASGFVVGEGAGFLVMKRLTTALQDGDHIHAVIRGIGASSDGSKTAPWAPNKEGQKLAYLRAFRQIPYSIHDLQYIECHGTGTQVGDIEELQGIEELIGAHFKHPIAIGSAKAAVGHLLTGAGMAGLFRTILAIQHQTLPPTANVKNLIPELQKPNCPLFVPKAPKNWEPAPQNPVRRAMVNSFGFGGTNYNLQVEEFNQEFHSTYPAQKLKNFRAHALERVPLAEIKLDESDKIYNLPIAITGLALRVPGASTPQEFISNLKEKHSWITEPPPERWDIKKYYSTQTEEKWKTMTVRGGFVPLPSKSETFRWKIPPITVKHLDPNQFRLFVTVEEALKNAKLLDRLELLENTAMICGNMMDSDFLFEEHKSVRFHFLTEFIRNHFPELSATQKENLISEFFDRIKNTLHTFNGDNSTSGIDSMLASRVAKFFDIKGGSMSLDAVCATGILAIDHACKALRSRELDAAIVCTSNMGMSGPLFCMYQDLTALSRSNEIRPFDKKRDGMLLGEGSIAFVLRRLPDALKDGSEIIALIHATATSSDGTSPQMLAPVKTTVKQAFESALEEFGERPPPIEFIECHGSGTPIGDQIEMECCHEVYSKNNPVQPLTLGSVKSSIGHLKVASAFASLVKTALSLQERVMFPTLNHDEPDPFLAKNAKTIRVLTQGPEDYKTPTPFAAVNAMGLGGINGHAILSAFNPADWKTSVKHYTEAVEEPSVLKSCPLHIFYHSEEELEQKLKKAKKLLHSSQISQIAELLRKEKIYLVNKKIAGQGKLAFLFPGQSSAYEGMYQKLSKSNSVVKTYLQETDAFCKKRHLAPLSSIVYGGEAESYLSSLFYSQIAPFTFQVAMAKILIQSFNIHPSLLMGHSVGEFAALCTANAFDFQIGLEILFERYRLVQKLLDEGQPPARMLVVRANSKEAQQFIEGLPHISIANINTPTQTVLSGLETSIQQAKARALEKGVDVKELAVSQAFHSPVLEPAVNPFFNYLNKINFKNPGIPITSLVHSKIYQDSESIPKNMAYALTAPLHFEKLLLLAQQMGVKHFVDVGPGWPLHKMVEKVLNPSGEFEAHFKTFYLNHPKEDDAESLLRFQEEFPLWQEIPLQTAPIITGSAEERGIQLGKLWRSHFTDYQWVWDRFPSEIKSNQETAIQNLNRDLTETEVQECKGIALGAKVSEDSVHLINSLSSLATSRYGLCCGLITPPEHPFKLHAANYDFPFVSASDANRLPRAVLEMHVPGKLSFLGIFKLGSPDPLCGMNQEGLSVSIAAAVPSGTLEQGYNIHRITRGLLENCKTLDDVKTYCQDKNLEGGWTFLIQSWHDKKGLRMEWRGKNKIIATSNLFTTNHFQDIQETLPVREDSQLRLGRLKNLYHKGISTLQDAMGILGDGFDPGRNSHPRFATINTLNRYNTSVSVIFDPKNQSLLASFDQIPSGRDTYYRFQFSSNEDRVSQNQGRALQKARASLAPSKTYRWIYRLGSRFEIQNHSPILKAPTLILMESKKSVNSYSKIILDILKNTPIQFLTLEEEPEGIQNNKSLSLFIDLTDFDKQNGDFFQASFENFLKKCKILKDLLLKGFAPKFILNAGVLPQLQTVKEPTYPSLEAVASHAFYQSLTQEFKGTEYHFLSYEPQLTIERKLKSILEIASPLDKTNSLTQTLPPLLVLSGKDYYATQQVLAPLHLIERTPGTPREETFLITGGAGGITAEIGLALAQKYGGKFILLGRSPMPDTQAPSRNQKEFLLKASKASPGLRPVQYLELWEKEKRSHSVLKNVRRYLALGVTAHYYPVDLMDESKTKEVLQTILKNHGPIHHVIHGAGTQRSKLFIEKSEKEFESIFKSKIDGTRNLLKPLCGQPLKSAFFFSSISGVSGNRGQTDYSATNAVLAGASSLLRECIPKNCALRIIHWPAWGETGMAMDSAVHAEMKTAGIEFMSIQDGIHFFLNEFSLQSPDQVITCTPAAKDATSASTLFPQETERAKIVSQLSQISQKPYVDEILKFSNDEIIFEKSFSGQEPFLQDHLVHGVPTLPGVVLTEIVLECASLLEGDIQKFDLRSIRFLHACTVDLRFGNRLRIRFQKISPHTLTYRFQITTPKRRSDGAVLLQEFLCSEGEVSLDNQVKAQITAHFNEQWKINFNQTLPLLKTDDFYKKLLNKFPEKLGPHFHTVQAVLKKDQNGILVQGKYHVGNGFGVGNFICHASLFDIMNHSVIEFLEDEEGILPYLPYEFIGLRLHGDFNPGQSYLLHLSHLERLKDRIHYRAAFYDLHFNLCLSVERVTHRKYSGY